MSAAAKYTVTLSPKQSAYVDSLIATGAYKAAEDVILEGLTILQDRDAALDDWLGADVLPICAAMDADPSLGRTPDQVADRLRAHHEQRSKAAL
jgi:antitoxin ParD1/3/4